MAFLRYFHTLPEAKPPKTRRLSSSVLHGFQQQLRFPQLQRPQRCRCVVASLDVGQGQLQ